MSTAIGRDWPVRPWRRYVPLRPEWSLYAVAAAAWAALAVRAGPAIRDGSGPHQHSPQPGSDVAHPMLMIAAMMLPVVVPHAQAVVRRGLWAHRHRAVAAFALGYLIAWWAFAVAGELAIAAIGRDATGAGPAMGLLVVAAAWHGTPARRALWQRCCRVAPMAAAGRRAVRDRLGAGWRTGLLCVGTCGPVMAVMLLSPGIGTALALSGVLLAEHRRGPNPAERVGAVGQAASLVVLAGVIGLATGIPAIRPLV